MTAFIFGEIPLIVPQLKVKLWNLNIMELLPMLEWDIWE